jgi:hypothetical protein
MLAAIMRVLTTILFILISISAVGQSIETQKAKIEIEVEQIENNCQHKPIHFTITALKKVKHDIQYTFIETSKGYVKITRQFSRKNVITFQSFFLKSGDLIYAIETTFYDSNKNSDSVKWSGKFYFSKGKLIDYITLGHGKSELEDWDPEQGILMAFQESKRDISRHKKMKNGG